MKTIAIILLAAGESSRMGTSKQMLEIDGKTLLERTMLALDPLQCIQRIAVLGANAQKHQPVVENHQGWQTVVNQSWQKGVGSSIKAGLRRVIEIHPATDAVLILVCDQPELTCAHLQAIVDQYLNSGCSIVASSYDKTEGVPALFDSRRFEALFAIGDSHGAKQIIEAYQPPQKIAIRFPEGAIDLDTPDDYRKYIEREGRTANKIKKPS
jgi:molybdenum cofactor cytidylyltransferase